LNPGDETRATHGAEEDRIKVKGGYRTIGLVLLLFAWGGAATWHLGAEDESEHKYLRVSEVYTFSDSGKSPASPAFFPARPRARKCVVSTASACPSFSGNPASGGTLLSLGCLLSV
jgi:hypothetical protein